MKKMDIKLHWNWESDWESISNIFTGLIHGNFSQIANEWRTFGYHSEDIWITVYYHAEKSPGYHDNIFISKFECDNHHFTWESLNASEWELIEERLRAENEIEEQINDILF